MNEKNLLIFKLFLAADIGMTRFLKLINAFGSAEGVFKASKNDLLSVEGIGEKISNEILNAANSGSAEKELEEAARRKIGIVLFSDSGYPEKLRNYPDMPPVLYIKGSLEERDFSSVSIVGARRATNYGKSVTGEFAGWFARNAITVVSGLARGIDTQAHKAALENSGRTVAVLGNGLLVNYPPENRNLQEQIPENGAVISEFPLMRQPDKATFPRRNRIVAAISKATLVTEAAEKSGAMITARFAAEYGKDVFAVPGSIYSQYSKGTNALINEGAFPATDPASMARQLGFGEAVKEKAAKELPLLENNEFSVLSLIEKSENGLHMDSISRQLTIDISDIAAIILKLEINGLVKAMPGQLYIRVR